MRRKDTRKFISHWLNVKFIRDTGSQVNSFVHPREVLLSRDLKLKQPRGSKKENATDAAATLLVI